MSGGAHYLYGEDPVEINAGRTKAVLTVANTGDRAVQVGSHYHFFETNRALLFDRAAAYGMRLDIPSGTAVRFEPGDTRDVELCAFAGTGRLDGFAGLVGGGLSAPDTRRAALRRAAERGFVRAGGDTDGAARAERTGSTADAEGAATTEGTHA